MFGVPMPPWLYTLINLGYGLLRLTELLVLYIFPALVFNLLGFVLVRDDMLIDQQPAPIWLLVLGVVALGLRWLQRQMEHYVQPEIKFYQPWMVALIEVFLGLLMAGLWYGLHWWPALTGAVGVEMWLLGLAWWSSYLPFGWTPPAYTAE